MPDRDRVLVVGTTPDYVEWIRNACPERALFLTDPLVRARAEEPLPSCAEEILCRLDDPGRVLETLDGHLEQWGQTLTGVACFDCESMEIAARLASALSLEYPGIDAVRNSRDKHLSKQLWNRRGVPCPEICPVSSLADVMAFFDRVDNGLVLKPLAGSGSELVFRCRTENECEKAFKDVKAGLEQRWGNPLFRTNASTDHLMLAEELIDGPEFSCDFLVENNAATIVRLTRKIAAADAPFGTIMAYVIPGELPGDAEMSGLERLVFEGADALGIQRGICMVDFIVRNNQPVFIEMTPRPGGDCLPFLLLEAGNLDILKLTLDFAENKPLGLSRPNTFRPHLGIRIFAGASGVLSRIDTGLLRSDPRIKQMHFFRKPGHIITMPPCDYDSWLLGHLIVEPGDDDCPETESLLISNRLSVVIEQP